MKAFLFCFFVILLPWTEVNAGGCFSSSAPKKVVLDPEIGAYLSSKITKLQENLYTLNVATLVNPQKASLFKGNYQFAGFGKLMQALYSFYSYQNGRLPRNEEILECFSFTLRLAQEQIPLSDEDPTSGWFYEALENEHEKIRSVLEEEFL